MKKEISINDMTTDWLCNLVKNYGAIYTSNGDPANTMDYPEDKQTIIESIQETGFRAYTRHSSHYEEICELLDFPVNGIMPRYVFLTNGIFFTPFNY